MSKMIKKTTSAKASEKAAATTEDLVLEEPKIFTGIFTAWSRKVPSKEDPKVILEKLKCVAQCRTAGGDTIDVSFWLTAEAASKFGIAHGGSFVGRVAYTDMTLESPKGQYNEERGLRNAHLVDMR